MRLWDISFSNMKSFICYYCKIILGYPVIWLPESSWMEKRLLKGDLYCLWVLRSSCHWRVLRSSCHRRVLRSSCHRTGPIFNFSWFLGPRGVRRGSAAAGLLGLRIRITPGICLLWVLCVVRLRSLRRAGHSSRGVLQSVVCLSVIVKPR